MSVQMVTALAATQAALTLTKAELDSMRADCNTKFSKLLNLSRTIYEDLLSTKSDLSSTKAQHDSTKAELESTKVELAYTRAEFRRHMQGAPLRPRTPPRISCPRLDRKRLHE